MLLSKPHFIVAYYHNLGYSINLNLHTFKYSSALTS